MLCIARGYGDEPLERISCGRARDTIWVLNPNQDDLDRVLEEGGGVGFPAEAVFQFNPQVFAKLKAAYASGDRARLLAAWMEATPLSRKAVPTVEWA